jgi:hypothetical protein
MFGLHRTPLPPPELAVLQGDLKSCLVRCREPELLLVLAWVQAELHRPRPGALRLVRTPSACEPGAWSGSFVELAGRLRKDIHALPLAELLILHGWVRDRLSHLGR